MPNPGLFHTLIHFWHKHTVFCDVCASLNFYAYTALLWICFIMDSSKRLRW